jgi:hypothetical protein
MGTEVFLHGPMTPPPRHRIWIRNRDWGLVCGWHKSKTKWVAPHQNASSHTSGLTVWGQGAGVAQSVQCLTTHWTTGVTSPAETKGSSSILCVQTGSEVTQLSIQRVPGSFPGSKAWLVRDAEDSPHPVPDQEWVGYITPLPLRVCMAVAGRLYFNLVRVTWVKFWPSPRYD